MNEQKLKRLFAAAREEAVPPGPPEFAADVMRALQREPKPVPLTGSISDQLNALFPRLALAAAGIMALCLLAEVGLTLAGMPDVGEGAAQAASQFLFNVEDL